MKYTHEQVHTFEAAVAVFGRGQQIPIVIEELSELIKAVCKHEYRDGAGTETRCAVIDEMADVHIMLKQLQLLYWIDDRELDPVITKKLERLSGRIAVKNAERLASVAHIPTSAEYYASLGAVTSEDADKEPQ
jgi:NTP pyrophosphatase (non-canonical NTP hydrolase)